MASAAAPANSSARLLSNPQTPKAEPPSPTASAAKDSKDTELAQALQRMEVGKSSDEQKDSGAGSAPHDQPPEPAAAADDEEELGAFSTFELAPGRIREIDGERAELEMEVHNKLVGRIIGKGGASIRELQDRTNTQILMPKVDVENKETKRTVKITGSPRDVRHCSLLIQLKTVPREDTQRIDQLSEALKEYQALTTRTMKIPAEHVGRVIGKNGQTIRHIQELSGAQIDLPKESRPGEDFRVLTMTGTEAEVDYCHQLLQIKITPREEGGAAGPGPSFAAYAANGMTALRVHIHADQVGRVIGRRGAHIRELQDESGAQIYLPKEGIPGTAVREVTICGTPEAVSKCQYLLQRKLTPPDQEPEPLMTIPPTWRPFMPPQAYPFHMPDPQAAHIEGGGQQMYAQVYNPYMDPASFVPPPGHGHDVMYSGYSVSPPVYRRTGGPAGNMMMQMPAGAAPPYMRTNEDQPHITHVPVPEHQLARVLGPSGEGLKELSQQTGAYMSFLPHVQGEPYTVVIQGLPQQILLSRSLIQARVGGL